MIFEDGYLKNFGIEYSAVVPFSACGIINERRLGALKKRLEPASVIVFLVPYYTGEEKRNISKYAISEDYHVFMRRLFDSVCPYLSEKYEADFCGMADSAPINEVKAAAYAGLGMIGDNGMLINEKYGSYVFIGAVYTNAVFDHEDDKTSFCVHCGACREACPMKNGRECLSAVTQKKGELTEEERDYIIEYGSAWGCDICADVCPYSRKAEKTPVKFFYENRTPYLTRAALEKMSDEEFAKRAYAWRGRAVIERNLKLFEKNESKTI